MIRNIIFDYGSVIIRTDCRRVYAPLFGSWEKATWFRDNILEEAWIRRLDIGDDYSQCIADLQKKHPEYADAIAMYDSRFADFLVGEMPGMNHLLARLQAEDYHLFGLSNYSHKIYDFERQLPIFRHLEGQIISSDVHIIKPDSRIFEALMARHDLNPEECLFIDDRNTNVAAAQALGIRSLLYPEIPFTREQILKGLPKEYTDKTTPDELKKFEALLFSELSNDMTFEKNMRYGSKKNI